jgi:hypothetical protein
MWGLGCSCPYWHSLMQGMRPVPGSSEAGGSWGRGQTCPCNAGAGLEASCSSMQGQRLSWRAEVSIRMHRQGQC